MDPINACFEFLGALFCLLSIREVQKDKKVAGISWLQVAFFTGWGYWNLLYYPLLGQPWSVVAALCLALANTVYTILLIYYSRKQKNEEASK